MITPLQQISYYKTVQKAHTLALQNISRILVPSPYPTHYPSFFLRVGTTRTSGEILSANSDFPFFTRSTAAKIDLLL